MIAYACRYGHQPLVPLIGDVTHERLERFCDAVHEWVEHERKNGASAAMAIAMGGG